MIAFLLRRIILAAGVLFIVISLTFLLMRLAPGNPFSSERSIAPVIMAELEAKYQLNGTLGHQYIHYLGDVLKGDLRLSTKYRNRTVNEILGQTLPVSLVVGATSFLLAMAIGITLGCAAALHRNQAIDRLAMFTALLGISIPAFVVAPVLILIFAVHLRWLPVAGWGSPDQLLLPAFCLALPYAASISRLMRGSLLEVLNQDFIRTARAKGLSDTKVVYRHALKVAILPVVSYCGPLAANILTGSMVIEQLFRIPGLGPFFIKSVLDRDLFVVGGTVIVYSLLLVTFNLLVDVVYFFLDRRIRFT